MTFSSRLQHTYHSFQGQVDLSMSSNRSHSIVGIGNKGDNVVEKFNKQWETNAVLKYYASTSFQFSDTTTKPQSQTSWIWIFLCHSHGKKKLDSSPKSTVSGKKNPLNSTTRSSISMQTRWATSTSGIMLML